MVIDMKLSYTKRYYDARNVDKALIFWIKDLNVPVSFAGNRFM